MGSPERHWEVQIVLGEAIAPYDRTFEALDRVMGLLCDDERDDIQDEVAGWFLPAEDNEGQHRQAADRRAKAVQWSKDHYGALVDWMVAAGLSDADAAPAPNAEG